MNPALLLLLSACAPTQLGVSGTAKAPAGEYCDGEDNDADGVVDEGCAPCDMLYTRVRSWWQGAQCVVEGGATGFTLLPVTVGGTTFGTWSDVSGFLGAPGANSRQRLGQQILVLRLNVAAFGIGDIPYHDWDGDGALETVAALATIADDLYTIGSDADRTAVFDVIAALNSEGSALPVYLDQACVKAAEICDGLDNDGDGVVDDACGCVEVCDGLDNNADGIADETGPDNDHDGFACDDCDDTRERAYPGAFEVPQNAVDEDCDGADATYTYDFDADVAPLFTAACVSCHSGAEPEAGLDLSPEVAYANIVGVASTQVPSLALVQPASTTQSYLYRKVMGTHTSVGGTGNRMPPGGPFLSFTQAGVLGTWIAEGAAPTCPDGDGDSWTCADCDDADPSVYPGAPEVRGDGIDQDCDEADLPFTYDLEDDIQPLFDAACVSCHGPTLAEAGLRLDPGYTLDEVVDVPASQLPSMDLLEPGDADASYLFHKLAGSHRSVGGTGTRMPQGGPFWLPEVLDMLRVWIDEGAPGDRCGDADGDGFTACVECDDADPGVFPGAAETCDGVDEDCDGSVDEDPVDPRSWYLDADHDGYGDDGTVVEACTAPVGYVGVAGDCDDSLAHVNPAAEEICGDVLDNDCSGDSPGCFLSGEYDGNDANARYWGGASDLLGHDIARAGDTDADGQDSFWVASAWTDTGASNSGSVYLLGGAADLHGPNPVSSEADATFRGEAANDNAGGAIDGDADINGDGLPDLIVGASNNDRGGSNAGTLYVLYAPFAGASSLGGATAMFTGDSASDQATSAAAMVPDVDGLGAVGLAVGGPGDTAGGASAGALWMVTTVGTGVQSLSGAAAKFVGENPSDQAGVAVSRAGDVNGDGLGDVIVGAHQNDEGASNAGAAYVLFAPFSGVVDLSAADVKLTGEAAGDIAGFIVGDATDVDGDGFDDVYVAAPNQDAGGTDAGAVYLVSGGISGGMSLSGATAKFVGEGSLTQLGVAAARAGDVNGDGVEDLIGGGRSWNNGTAAVGAAWVWFQPVVGTLPVADADVRFAGLAAGDSFGDRAAGVGDVDSDGFGDLAIAATAEDSGGSSSGAVYVYLSPGY